MIFVSSKISDGNMDFRFGESKKVSENRKRVFSRLGIQSVVEVTQVHGNQVLVVDGTSDPQTEADGLISNKKDIYLMIKLADCMAIGFHDSKHNTIGLAHAGSKGLEKGVIKNTIKKMVKNFQTYPKKLIVKISPSIGPCHYRIDLLQEAEKQLVKTGVLKENIENPKICTYESKDYFSHRRSEDTKTAEGRFVTILGLKG